MSHTGAEEHAAVQYRLNQHDEIAWVSDSWLAFAAVNDAPELTPECVRGRSLREFIADPTTAHLYGQMVAQVRRDKVVRFRFRCDSPHRRRLMEMTIRLAAGGLVEFDTRLLYAEERVPVPFLARSAPRSERRLAACGWCSQIKLTADRWADAEVTVRELKLFEQERMPQLAHGICRGCLVQVRKDLEYGVPEVH